MPLQIFAEADSWFDYPVSFFGGGIIPRLENRLGVPILNLAKAGDEVRCMLGVEERAYSSRNAWVTIALRDKLSPGTHLVFQGYDFAIPDGQGICGYGP